MDPNHGSNAIQSPGESYEPSSRRESSSRVFYPPRTRLRPLLPPLRSSRQSWSGALYGTQNNDNQYESPPPSPPKRGGGQSIASPKNRRPPPPSPPPMNPVAVQPPNLDSRRRNPRVSGSDLYVARLKKSGSGVGNAMPCWRCVEWCRWAGVKRIFHWDAEVGKWGVVKVNDTERKMYQTRSDFKIVSRRSGSGLVH